MPDGIPENVVDHAGEIVVVDDRARLEPVAEEVAGALVLPVELLRVDAVDAVEAAREGGLRRRDDEVVVVAEQRQRVHVPRVRVDGVADELEELEAVAPVAEDRAAVDAFDPDVEDAVGEPSSERSGHLLPR